RPDGVLLYALDGELLEDQAVELKRIPVTNRMRGQLRDILARLNINAPSPQVRFQAVQRLINEGVNDESILLLRERQQEETSLLVNNAINSALSLYKLNNEDKYERIDAIKNLRGSLERETRNELRRLRDF